MLGRLLNTAASTLNPAGYSGKNHPQLESVTEEEHTSGLLFPDASLLRRSNTHAYPLHTTFNSPTFNSPNASTAGAYDDRGGVELDYMKDFRVIIAQNALGDRDACVLLDTRASSPDAISHGLGLEPQLFEPSGPRHARTVSTLSRGSRRSYLPHASAVEPSPLSMASDTRRSPPVMAGAFMRARGRSSTLAPGGVFHDPARHAADTNDSGLLNCIFGSSAFSYRGSSTKMHIISADDEPGRTASASPATRQSMSRAYSTGSSAGFPASNFGNEGKPPSKVTVLLTRMFSVNLPEASDSTSPDKSDLAYQESLPETGFPFPDVTKRKKIKEKKTPMYAVAITIQIPLLSRNSTRPLSRVSTMGPDSPRPGMACSLDSDDRWRGAFLDDSLSMASPPASLDERIDLLVDHWDVINRTLSHLERLSRKEILFLLKKVDASSAGHPKPAKAPNMQRTNQTIVHLPANILAVNSKLREEAIRSTRRISSALQTPYVVTGQSRWGVWREEGRSIARTLGDKEHSFFFMVLITAFLGNHTEWLNALGPDWYRRRHYMQQKAQLQEPDPILAHRTVIISPDKMTARRLIFLLSAFLPPKQRFEPLPSPLRPGTSTSMRAISQSPPTVPVLRQESLRRAIERRSRAQRLNLPDRDQHQRSVSVSSNETAHRSADDADTSVPTNMGSRRRDSDARSIRTIGVPIHSRDMRTKNTSTATTSTATPGTTVPVPHFASQSRMDREESDQTQAEGNDSLASENLLKNLQRSESSVMSANSSVPSSSGRWGNLFSGLWSSRQEPSTDGSEPLSPAEIRKRSVSSYTSPPKRGPPTLSQMVKEVSAPPEDPKVTTSGNISIPNSKAQRESQEEEEAQDLSSTTETKESSLKLSVRGDDGIVDVDLPLPGFVSLSSSGDSTMASPKKTRTSVTSVDAVASTHSSNSGFHYQSKENDSLKINVSGWLRHFHEDFLLQAVRPYATLEADIKRAMRAEPTPSHAFYSDMDNSDRWVDVATTLVADVRNSTVKRLRLKRRAAASSQPPTPRHTGSGSVTPSPLASVFSITTPTKTPEDVSEAPEIEERFVEEPVMDLDGTLVDALERVLAHSDPSSTAPTRAPSPSRGRRNSKAAATASTNPEQHQSSISRDEVPSLEVPRTECRRLVLGALEEVVRSVTAEHCRDDVDGELGLADRERKRSLAGVDNTLREGVRKWLLDVEEAW